MDESLDADLKRIDKWNHALVRMMAERDYWRGVAAFYRDLPRDISQHERSHLGWEHRKVLSYFFVDW